MHTPCLALCECGLGSRPPCPHSGPVSQPWGGGPLCPVSSGLQSVQQEGENVLRALGPGILRRVEGWGEQKGRPQHREGLGDLPGHPGPLPVFGPHLLCAWSGLSSRCGLCPCAATPSPCPPGPAGICWVPSSWRGHDPASARGSGCGWNLGYKALVCPLHPPFLQPSLQLLMGLPPDGVCEPRCDEKALLSGVRPRVQIQALPLSATGARVDASVYEPQVPHLFC